MKSTIFSTINGLSSLPVGGLVGTDVIETEREGLSYKADMTTLGAYLNTLIDLNAIVQYVLDNIDLTPDLAAILQYVKENLDVVDLQNYTELNPLENVVVEYNSITNKFIPSPLGLNQILPGTAVVYWNRELGHNAEILLTQNTEVVLDDFIPGTYQLTVNQNGTGNNVLTISSNTHPILWANGIVPANTLTANASDTYTFIVPPSNSDIRGVPQYSFS